MATDFFLVWTICHPAPGMGNHYHLFIFTDTEFEFFALFFF